MIDEAELHCLPLGSESLPLGSVVHAGCAAGQFRLGLPRRTVLQNSAIVFQSLPVTQGRSLNSAVFKILDSGDGNNDEYYRCNGEHANREVVEHCVLPGGISVPAKGA